MTHLTQTACHNGSTHTVIIEHHDMCAPYTNVLICGLDKLAARRVLSTRQRGRVELIVCSHIAQKNGVFILCLPVHDRGSIYVGYIHLTSPSLRAGLRAVVMVHLAVLAGERESKRQNYSH